MRRFWKTATATAVGEGFAIRIDDRPVKTPHRNPLVLPTSTLADAITDEWNAVGETIDPRAMPMTGLANAAIDIVSADPTAFAAMLAAYGETDLLAYRAEGPSDLVVGQAAAWDPIIDWARARYDIHFTIITGIMHRPQPDATVTRLADAIGAHEPFALAALSPVVTIGGSLVTALALAEDAFQADDIWEKLWFDELWQESRWGTDALAIQAREMKRWEFDAAVRFLELSRR